MKLTLWLSTAAVFMALVSAGCDKARLDTDDQKAGYAVGQQIGTNLKNQGVTLDGNAVAAGLTDALQAKPPRMTPEEVQKAMMKLQEAAMKKMGESSDKNKKEGQEFLEKNKAKEGWKTTADGLQYHVVVEGSGKMPKDSDTVTVNYTGKLIDGKKFDSSVDRGKPAEFPVNGVIRGWSEALKLMKVGSKYELAIPPELGYGTSANQAIPANSVLLFDVELVGVNGK